MSLSETSLEAATASRAPTGNVAPAGATMRRNVPPSGASKTLVILVVSISRSSSPSLKLWPGCLSHPTTLPSVIVRPHFGIVIGVISELIVQRSSAARASSDTSSGVPVNLAHCLGDPLGARDVELF